MSTTICDKLYVSKFPFQEPYTQNFQICENIILRISFFRIKFQVTKYYENVDDIWIRMIFP